MMSCFFLLFLTFAQPTFAHIPLGKLAGGDLKVREDINREDEEGNAAGSFSVEWKKGKTRKAKELFSFSEPSIWADDYKLESAKLDGHKITVVLRRQGSKMGRGNDTFTYQLSFDPETLRFSKPVENVVSDLDIAEKSVRDFYLSKCDPAATPSDDFIEENIASYIGDGSLVYLDDVPPLMFSAMHECALRAHKHGDFVKAREFAEKALTPLAKEKDWICRMQEKPENCKTWKEYFFGEFIKQNSTLANNLGFFLAGDKKTFALAKEVLNAVVAAVPNRGVARLNLADLLWDMGERDGAKIQYREYLKLPAGKGKGADRERKKAKERSERS